MLLEQCTCSHPAHLGKSAEDFNLDSCQVLTFTQTSPPGPSRLRDAIKSLSHTVEITFYFNQGWDPSTLKGRHWHKSLFRVCTICFWKYLSSPQGQTSTSAADNRLTNPKALTHKTKIKQNKIHPRTEKKNHNQIKPPKNTNTHIHTKKATKEEAGPSPSTQTRAVPLHHHSFTAMLQH